MNNFFSSQVDIYLHHQFYYGLYFFVLSICVKLQYKISKKMLLLIQQFCMRCIVIILIVL